ncbi:MAG TPA: twin-arginine translocase subunit TatC [Candidatus Krumholzibacteria bacterium]|nr:twin-arginine translocase subunit TatC [Candidatus Krumholzibacteria bacterium]
MRPFRSPAERTEILREMSFLEHLGELRGVLVASTIAFLGLSVVYWFFSGTILDWVVARVPLDHLVFYAPSEAFMVRTKVAFVLGGMTAFPYIAYRLWRFVTPGLFTREKSRVGPVVAASAVLFYGGVTFCYFVVAPAIINFMLGYATDRVQPMLSVSAYFNTVARLCLAFGLVFQLPIVVLLLAVTGLVSPRTFLRQWRYAVVIIFVAAAIFTPPDPVSQVLMAVPLVVLYIGSALVASALVRRRTA